MSELYLAASTKTEQKQIEFEHGIRYTELNRLPYYDPIKCHLVDPMHCLLLGVAKHTLKVWIEVGNLKESSLEKIDQRLKEVKFPPGYCTLPSAISSAFHSMKSDEYKTWVLYLSIFCLRDILPKPHFNMWQAFVRACHILLKPYITHEEVYLAHSLLRLFNETYERILGKEYCTPNMHMQLHIKDCILEFGPVYAFWCYSFERYNGILGQYQTNNKSITVQLMRKFLEHHSVTTSYSNISIDVPTLSELGLLSKKNDDIVNSLIPIYNYRVSKEFKSSFIMETKCTYLSGATLKCLTKDDILTIETLLKTFFQESSINVSRFVNSYLRVKFGRSVIACSRYREKDNKNHYVMVLEDGEKRPGFVTNIFGVSVTVDGENLHVPFSEVKLFQKHPYQHFYGNLCPMQIWSTSIEAELFVPVQAIYSKCVIVQSKNTFERMTLGANRLSQVKTADIVNFVFEILT